MFQPFNRSEESWGNLAHVDEESLTQGLRPLGASSKLKPAGSKKFSVNGIEEITVKRTSKSMTILARGQDDASRRARELQFEYADDKIFDAVVALIQGMTGKEPTIKRLIATRKSQ